MEIHIEKDLYNFEHRWKLKDWIKDASRADQDTPHSGKVCKIDYEWIGSNCRAYYLIECNPTRSEWKYLSQQANALYLLEKNPDKISWYSFKNYNSSYHMLKKNPQHLEKNKKIYSFESAMDFINDKLKNNIEDVDWRELSINPRAINILKNNKSKIDWSYLAMNSNPETYHLIKEEIENIFNNPKDDKYRMFWYCLVGNQRNPKVKDIFIEYMDRIEKINDPCLKRLSERRDVELLPYFEKKINELNLEELLDEPELEKLCKISLRALNSNPIAVDLLLKYEKIINWNYFSHNRSPKAIAYLKENRSKIKWDFMCENRNDEGMELIKEKVLNNDFTGISFRALSSNPFIFELDYEFFFNRMNIIRKELMEKTWHPNRFRDWCLDIEEIRDLNM